MATSKIALIRPFAFLVHELFIIFCRSISYNGVHCDFYVFGKFRFRFLGDIWLWAWPDRDNSHIEYRGHAHLGQDTAPDCTLEPQSGNEASSQR